MRKVTIYSTKTKAQQVIETGVNTWGELKQLINPEMGVSSAKCMVRENRTTLESNEAILPTSDITIFVYPEKVKSGAGKKKEDAYAPLSSAKLRKACQKKSLATTGEDYHLRTRLRAYDSRHGIDSTSSDAPKLHKKSKKLKATTLTVEEPSTAVSETTLCEAHALEQEAIKVADVDFNSKATPLQPNSNISIHSVVRLMRNKFMNMFDEIEEQINSGEVDTNEEILDQQARALAEEIGLPLLEEDNDTL